MDRVVLYGLIVSHMRLQAVSEWAVVCCRQVSYDETLNPFGDEETESQVGENSNTNAANNSIDK